VLTGAEEKKEYFNRYWQTRDIPTADARSCQRAELVASLLGDSGSGKILDVGCGRGLVLKYLSGRGYDIEGCDLASDSIALLKDEGFEVFLFDIEQDELPGKYNGIICLEVLQQVFDPLAALRRFTNALHEDSCLIISVPNELHLWMRLRLLFGKSHLGHFDESHIRLFTPDRARELFHLAGLKIERVVPVSIIPPDLNFLRQLGKVLARAIPSLFSLSQIYRLKLR
jgi:2-polyprenyl-3-methyl-5-hydroxy-6-metoxy-1,4-benzoquinol methylase